MSQANRRHKKNTTSIYGQGKSAGKIRIIAGKYRGRKLPVLMAEGLRPTTDRVKETVFNWLMPYLNNANCLDCFAGSGGLGFEALSRGATHVTLVELNKAAATQLIANKTLLKAEHVTVYNTDVLSFLNPPTCNTNKTLYDLVFLDPPFHQQLVEQTAKYLNNQCLTDQALIYVEMEAHSHQQLPHNWQLIKQKVAGQVVYQLYQYHITDL
jgi:16S rRNA (guanine966-N2)-methyltransferase